MKGVSEVIAIILILMIVIALAALAYTWFSGIFASMTGAAGIAVTSTTNAMATQFRIESAKVTWTNCVPSYTIPLNGCINVTVRNYGTQSIDLTKAIPYTSGMMGGVKGNTAPSSILSANGGIAMLYNVTNGTAITCGTSTITIAIETGLTDTRIISC